MKNNVGNKTVIRMLKWILGVSLEDKKRSEYIFGKVGWNILMTSCIAVLY